MVPILGKNLCLDLMTYFVLAHPVLEGAAVILKLLLNHQSTYTQVQNVWSGSMAIRFVEFSNRGTKLEIFLPKNQHTQRKLLNFEF